MNLIDVSHEAVSREAWTAARKALLSKEKELTRLRDELNRERRALPRVKVKADYLFSGPNGVYTLADLFDGKNQLIVYHFMFGPGWEEGCKNCSFLADHIDGTLVHLANRDTTLVAASRAPVAEIEAFRSRMGWRFPWLSTAGSDFNFDFQASFNRNSSADKVFYNYEMSDFEQDEAPGLSVFCKNSGGELFHTYSAYARGLDILFGTYNLLDMTPNGRDEAELPSHMSWVRHHDRYGLDSAKNECHKAKRKGA